MPDEKLSSEYAKRLRVNDGHWLSRTDNGNCIRSEYSWHPSSREESREESLGLWLGPERQSEVFASLRPEAMHIGVVVKAILEKMDVSEMNLLDRLRRDWASLVGDVNARQCAPLSIDGMKLKVEVYNSTYLYILKSQQAVVIGRRLAEVTAGKVTGVAFVAAGSRRRS